MDGKMLARVGAVVFVAVAVTATAIEMTRKEEPPELWPSGRATQSQSDPLRDELIRCQALGEAGMRRILDEGNRLADGFGRVVFKTRWNHQGLLSFVGKQQLSIGESPFPTQ